MGVLDKKQDSESISKLAKRVSALEDELSRLEALETSMAQNEIVLSKKITDLNRIEKKTEELVTQEQFESLKTELKKLEKHEEMLGENYGFITELGKELEKIKSSHSLTRKKVMAQEKVEKKDCEERFKAVREAMQKIEKLGKKHHSKAEKQEITELRKELHDRLSQIEHQNKLLMKYLKKVDEVLQRKAQKFT